MNQRARQSKTCTYGFFGNLLFADRKPALRRSAFTLIELLVVIAIISLLVSILLPSLQKAKELAKNTLCATQIRALGTAVNVYASEYNGYYVPNPKIDPKSPEVVNRYEVCNRLNNDYGCSPQTFYCPFRPADSYSSKRPEDEFYIFWNSPYDGHWVQIGYTYLACMDEDPSKNPGSQFIFLNDYHSPMTLESANPRWVLMTDQCRGWAGQTNHWFDDGYNTNVLYVDQHVETRDDDNASINFMDRFGWGFIVRW